VVNHFSPKLPESETLKIHFGLLGAKPQHERAKVIAAADPAQRGFQLEEEFIVQIKLAEQLRVFIQKRHGAL